jgi:hypothetical protein
VATEFVEVVDGAPSHYRPEDLLSGSGARCRWRCSVCAREWVTTVANRTKRRSGCPDCACHRHLEIARARPAKSHPLSETSQELVRDFAQNLSRPDRDSSSTPSGSHDRVLWRCRQGHEWEASARQRVKHGSQCPTCLAGLWTSRLEFEVAELVQLTTGLTVVLGPSYPRSDRAAKERVDLLVTGADVLVDLDPTRWHAPADAVERDARKLARLAGRRYVRVRPRNLGLLPPGCSDRRQQVVLPGGDETDPWMWTSAVVGALRAFDDGVRSEQPTIEARTAARVRADARWRTLRSGLRTRSLLSAQPEVAGQFVRAWTGQGSRQQTSPLAVTIGFSGDVPSADTSGKRAWPIGQLWGPAALPVPNVAAPRRTRHRAQEGASQTDIRDWSGTPSRTRPIRASRCSMSSPTAPTAAGGHARTAVGPGSPLHIR